MKKNWSTPKLQVLGLENTLCDDYIPAHGQDDQNGGPGNSGKLPCPYCNHSCPNETTLNKHIRDIHGPIPPTDIVPPLS